MQPMNMIMIYYLDKKLKKRLHVLEADIVTYLPTPPLRQDMTQGQFF